MTELSKLDPEEVEERPLFDAAELGAMMREARQTMDRDIKDVAQELRIRRPYLEAIEDGRLGDLPGPAYTTGFLKSYSNYLGLDGDEIVGRFKRAGIDIEKRTSLHLPSPMEDGRLPTGSLFMVAVVLAAVIYAGVYFTSSGDRELSDGRGAIPAEFSSVTEDAGGREGAAASSETEETPATSAAPATQSTPAADKPMPKPQQVAAVPEPAPASAPVESPKPVPGTSASNALAASTADVDAAASSQPATSEAPKKAAMAVPAMEVPLMPPATSSVLPKRRSSNAPEPQGPDATPAAQDGSVETAAIPASSTNSTNSTADQGVASTEAASTEAASSQTVVVKAIADSWVEIRAIGKKPLISRLMRQGETYSVTSRPGLVMVTGNAGGVELSVGGATIPKLGPMGKILQNVPIDADSLLKRQSSTQ